MTRGAAVRWAGRLLADAGVESPRVEAEVLLAEVLQAPRYVAYWEPAEVLTDGESRRFTEATRRRASREPLQYVVGRETFCGLEFVVTPDVLIPRPETEGAVSAALNALASRERPVIADLGTGSGCLALSIAAARPDAVLWAVDRSAAALRVAQHNAERLGLAPQVRFAEGDLFEPLVRGGVRVDLVVSNPPYVAEQEYGTLQPEVRFEPATALRGGLDGLDFFRRIAAGASAILVPGGRIVLEIGFGQAASVRAIAEGAGWIVERVDADANEIPRIMTFAGSRPWT